MVSYYFKVLVPSLGRRVSFKEITIRDYININKSILNNDYGEIIECFDLIIAESCIEKDLTFTLLDKVVILLSIRSYSISSFCEITISDKEQGMEFQHKLELSQLITAVTNLPIEHSKQFGINGVDIEFGIPFNPTKDNNVISAADFIHSVGREGKVIMDHNSSRKDLNELIDALDVDFLTMINEYARKLATTFYSHPLYIIKSPWSAGRELVTQRMSLDFTIYDLLKMLFTENLHNLYRSLYNFNQTLNISPAYTEGLIPVEKDLLWGYYTKDQRDAEAAKASGVKSGNFQP